MKPFGLSILSAVAGWGIYEVYKNSKKEAFVLAIVTVVGIIVASLGE